MVSTAPSNTEGNNQKMLRKRDTTTTRRAKSVFSGVFRDNNNPDKSLEMLCSMLNTSTNTLHNDLNESNISYDNSQEDYDKIEKGKALKSLFYYNNY